jgi:hypothetical protein
MVCLVKILLGNCLIDAHFHEKQNISGIRFTFRQADEHFAAKAAMEGPIAKVNTLPKHENSETLARCTFWCSQWGS